MLLLRSAVSAGGRAVRSWSRWFFGADMTDVPTKFSETRSFTLSHNRDADELVRQVVTELGREVGGLASEFGLAALVLGGGYGRGEGGAVVTPGQPVSLYNDMDFFVFTRHAGRRRRRRLDIRLGALAESWSARLGIDMDFAAAREVSRLPGLPVSLMYQELRRGHCYVFAEEDVVAQIPLAPPSALPVLEGLRLHMNRGAGLLRANQILSGAGSAGPAERDFVWRNLHKCALGCGDALLIAAGQYDFDLGLRRRRLPAVAERLGDSSASRGLCECYEAAVAFKTHPSRDVAGDASGLAAGLRAQWRQVLAASLACRLPPSAGLGLRDQLASAEVRGGVWWKNYLLNAVYGLSRGGGAGCAMPPQYWLLVRLDRLLARETADPREVAHFLTLWKRFN